MSKEYQYYIKQKQEIKYLQYAMFVINYDVNTVCPKKDKVNGLDCMDHLYGKYLKIVNNPKYEASLFYLQNHPEELKEIEFVAIKKELKDIIKLKKIPLKMQLEGSKIRNDAQLSWENARKDLNYVPFDHDLARLVDYTNRYIKLEENPYYGYDVLLDDMEDDFTIKKYDEFFSLLEEKVLPLMKKILSMPKKYNTSIRQVKFDIDKQRKLTKLIAERMHYTDQVGYIGETIHPFTDGINSTDVRTTTNYSEDLLFSNIYSVMHEIGHATYELQNDAQLNGTVLFGGASCALHESQSRFYENYLGRSKEFIEFLYPLLKEVYPEELKDYSFEDIYYYVNDVEAQFKRVEADELTYPFHVLIRYKVEKDLFTGKINSSQIEETFNLYMKEYLGITPSNKLEGCFQDVHWSSGFGYFPTYALGSAMSAQFYHYLSKDINVKEMMKKGDFTQINAWLKEHIHRYGGSKKNMEVIKIATGEDFNPNYYIDYLIEKFSKLYDL